MGKWRVKVGNPQLRKPPAPTDVVAEVKDHRTRGHTLSQTGGKWSPRPWHVSTMRPGDCQSPPLSS